MGALTLVWPLSYGRSLAQAPASDHRMPGHGSMMSGYQDRAYLSAMIAHHQAAVDMAREVLNSGRDEQVKKWAEEIIKAQESEIGEMNGWLAALGGEDAEAAGMMRQAMQGMMAAPFASDPDRNFVGLMIDHHAGAVDMAVQAVVKSDDERIVGLSRGIINAQLDEITAFRKWLREQSQTALMKMRKTREVLR